MSRALAAALALVGVAAEVVAVAAAPAGHARWSEVAVGLGVAAYAVVGLLIVWHRPGHRVGRLMVALGSAWGLGEALVATSYAVLDDHPDHRVAALASVVGSLLRGLPWLVAVLWLPLRFPDGLPLRTRLSTVAERIAQATLLVFVAVSLASEHLTDLRVDSVDNPIGVSHPAAGVVDALAGLLLLLGISGIGLAVCVLAQRYRRTGALGRQQTVIFGLSFLPPVAALAASFTDSADPLLFGLVSLPVPVAIGVALLTRQLYDLPLAVNRSLTYGTLWLAIALLYAITVGGVGAMLRQEGADWVPWVAAGVVAVCFAPLRDALQRAANRITYGQWASPGEVLTRTSRRLADAVEVRELLGSLATELAEGLGLGHVDITDADGRELASHGPVTGRLDRLELTAYGAPVGGLRWTHRDLRDADRALLADLAAQLGSVVHADGLLGSVRAAQERLVLAREEERRRLRRDLHDGVGPALAGLGLQVDTLRNRLTDPEAEPGLLALRDGIRETVLDVRRIVEGLRPASLDDLGLVEAVHQLAGRTAVPVTVEADGELQLPAAVEVAAYRIVQEALSNVARHSGARSAQVRLCLSGATLRVVVADDGCGVVTPRRGGVGLGSMRERAEEIGGSLALWASRGAGTTITAALPLPPGGAS